MNGAVVWFLGSSLFLASAGANVVGEVAGLRLNAFAESVETSKDVPDLSPALETRIRQEVARLDDCRRPIARSRVTASLFALQSRISAAGGVNRDDPLLADVREAAAGALACNPLDGNLWFLSGWYARIVAGEAVRFDRFLDMSVATAPLEGEVLERRWTLMAPVLSTLGIPDQAVLVEDLGNMLAYADTKAAASVLVTLRDTGSWQMADAALSRVADARRDALAAAATPEQAPTLGSDKFRQFEFTPVGPVRREQP